ncbi:MAG: glycoside hydrolase family 43 protein, partial [Duncaniella sp.]|nr:glycoside hydrolase family 43 protein [Duncaniella sp.]
TPACVLRRMQHHCFVAETEVEPAADSAGAAGILMVKNEQRQLFLAVQGGKIVLYKLGKKRDNDLMASAEVGALTGPVGLKVESKGVTYDFFYRLPGGVWTELAAGVPAEHIATQRGGFTGSTIGLYATSAPL